MSSRSKQKAKARGLRASVDDIQRRVRIDVRELFGQVSDRSPADVGELDIARLRRFVLNRVYDGMWCRQRARLVWLEFEEVVKEMAALPAIAHLDIGKRQLPFIRRAMPVGLVYAFKSETDGVMIGWTDTSEEDDALRQDDRRIVSAYATRADWAFIQELCAPYAVGRGQYTLMALLPLTCGWVLPASTHDEAWRLGVRPDKRLLEKQASDLQRRVFVKLSVHDLLQGVTGVAHWARRQVDEKADDIDFSHIPDTDVSVEDFITRIQNAGLAARAVSVFPLKVIGGRRRIERDGLVTYHEAFSVWRDSTGYRVAIATPQDGNLGQRSEPLWDLDAVAAFIERAYGEAHRLARSAG